MKKNIVLMAALVATIAGGVLMMSACTGHTDQKDPVLCGAFTEQREVSREEMELFDKVMGDSDFAFRPLSVSTQVVAGLNYRFYCRYDDKSGESPDYCFITIYQPLQGDPSLRKVEAETGGPEMKIVTDKNWNVARYLGEDETSVHCETQDDYWVSKDSVTVETVYARCGKGFLTLKEPGSKQVLRYLSSDSPAVGTMIHEEGYVPEVYRCLGYLSGWFLVEVDEKAGFIQESFVLWDAINTY